MIEKSLLKGLKAWIKKQFYRLIAYGSLIQAKVFKSFLSGKIKYLYQNVFFSFSRQHHNKLPETLPFLQARHLYQIRIIISH